MARIFISYSRKDEIFARQLATSLTASGADVWIDLEDIPAGMKWSSAIQEGLDQGDLMVVIISPDSMVSRNVEDEWQYYLDNGKPVIPVLLQPAKIHFQLARIQYIDFHKQPYGRALTQLYTEFRRKGVPLELAPNVVEKAPVSHMPPPSGATQPIQRPSLTPLAEAAPVPTAITSSPIRQRNRLIIGGGIVAALMLGLIIGLVSFSGANATQPTPTATQAVVIAPSATAEPPTAIIPSDTPVPTQTDTPTLTPTPALRIGFNTPITRNRDWTPITQNFSGVDMALVAAGCFTMGSSDAQIAEAYALCPLNRDTCGNLLTDERPQAVVCFQQPFWIDITEATNATGSPRNNITWQDALAQCQGRGGRLPTEAEWEYAARGPDGLIFPWGNSFDQSTFNFCDADCQFDWRVSSFRDGHSGIAPVGSYAAGVSWVGALDMAGNLWEWTSSIYNPYPYNANDGRENLNDTASQRTLRGGSWNWIPLDARTAARDNPVQASSDWYGFRCVREYTEPTTGNYVIRVAVPLANLRNGPSVDYPLTGTALEGEEFTARGQAEGRSSEGEMVTWYLVDNEQWISERNVEIPMNRTAPTPPVFGAQGNIDN